MVLGPPGVFDFPIEDIHAYGKWTTQSRRARPRGPLPWKPEACRREQTTHTKPHELAALAEIDTNLSGTCIDQAAFGEPESTEVVPAEFGIFRN